MFTSSLSPSVASRSQLKPYEFVSGPDYPFLKNSSSGLQPILMFLGGAGRRRWLVCEAERDWKEAVAVLDGRQAVQVRTGGHNFQKRTAWFFLRYSKAARLFRKICRQREVYWQSVAERARSF